MNMKNVSYAQVFPEVLSQDGRRIAKQVIACLKVAGARNLTAARVLDLGCSNGFLTRALGKYVRHITGIDTDMYALEKAKKNGKRIHVRLSVYGGSTIPFPNAFFDIVIVRRVYESAAHPYRLAQEVERILIPGGLVYFEGTNKYSPFGTDNSLPFFAPRVLVTLFLKISGKKTYYLNRFMSYRQLCRLWKNFTVVDLTAHILHRPSAFSFVRLARWEKLIRHVPLPFLRFLAYFSPTFIWVLRKPDTLRTK